MILAITTIGLIFAAAWFGYKNFLVPFAASALMLLLHTIGFGYITELGFTTNVGTYMYGGVIFALYLTYIMHGKRWAEAVKYKTAWMLIAYTLVSLALQYSNIDLDSLKIYNHLFTYDLQVVAASFAAFYISCSFLIMWMDKMRTRGFCPSGWSAFLGMSLAQILDSFIFFPLAFAGTLDAATLLTIAKGGLIIKIIMAAISAPLICVLLKYGKRDIFREDDPLLELSNKV